MVKMRVFCSAFKKYINGPSTHAISAFIHISQEIQCLLYVGYFFYALPKGRVNKQKTEESVTTFHLGLPPPPSTVTQVR